MALILPILNREGDHCFSMTRIACSALSPSPRSDRGLAGCHVGLEKIIRRSSDGLVSSCWHNGPRPRCATECSHHWRTHGAGRRGPEHPPGPAMAPCAPMWSPWRQRSQAASSSCPSATTSSCARATAAGRGPVGRHDRHRADQSATRPPITGIASWYRGGSRECG